MYRCADLANALTFITSDIEKLEKEMRLTKYKELVKEQLDKCLEKGFKRVSSEIDVEAVAKQS